MKKYNCPNCGKELIRLEPFEEDIYTYWCDTCNIDITIEDNDKNWLKHLELYKKESNAMNNKKSDKIIGKEYNKRNILRFVRLLEDGQMYVQFTLQKDGKKCFRIPVGILTAKPLVDSNGIQYVELVDTQINDRNIGDASILMNYFMEYCKNSDAKYITGDLSYVDRDHFDKLEYFYKKYGFSVTFNKDKTSGSIKYSLIEDGKNV